MKPVVSIVLAIVVLLSVSGAVYAEDNSTYGSYSLYSQYLFQGKQQMRRGEFQKAQAYFVKAVGVQRLTEALAFAATASYKINDVRAAESYITEAEKLDSGSVTKRRIEGYKALIYLKERRESEGMKALREYTTLYGYLDPLMNIREVEAMALVGKVDPEKLEALLDEQITWHEDEIEQYEKTGTGFYGRYD
jgi:tetratricopeptide (TPR) repeat protein